jgi:predicted CXXCH cytochrome family protein
VPSAIRPSQATRARFDIAFGVTFALLLATLLLAFRAVHLPLAWEIGCAAGLLSALIVLLLFAWPMRGRDRVPLAPIAPGRHRDLALACFALALGHAVALIWAEPLLLEYLKPTAPLHMLTGIAALAALLALVATGFESVRRRLWRSARGFQATHVGVAIAALAATGAHVIASARYVDSRWKVAVLCGASTLAALGILRARRSPSPQSDEAHSWTSSTRWRNLLTDSSFGPHAAMVAVLVLLAVAAVALLLVPVNQAALRRPVFARTEPLPLAFPHGRHRSVACVACHHNFVDGTGMTGCISCHRSARADLKLAAEPRFHDFCFTCHIERRANRHGPVRSCGGCHADRPEGNGADQRAAVAPVVSWSRSATPWTARRNWRGDWMWVNNSRVPPLPVTVMSP